MRLCKKGWAHLLCIVFLLTGLTACSGSGNPTVSGPSLTVAPDYTDGGAPVVKPGPEANSGVKGVIYTIPYAKWITEDRTRTLGCFFAHQQIRTQFGFKNNSYSIGRPFQKIHKRAA